MTCARCLLLIDAPNGGTTAAPCIDCMPAATELPRSDDDIPWCRCLGCGVVGYVANPRSGPVRFYSRWQEAEDARDEYAREIYPEGDVLEEDVDPKSVRFLSIACFACSSYDIRSR